MQNSPKKEQMRWIIEHNAVTRAEVWPFCNYCRAVLWESAGADMKAEGKGRWSNKDL